MSYRLMFGYTVLGALGLAFLIAAILVVRVITLDTPAPRATRSADATYVVQDGDSLAGISRETGVPLREIEDLNPSLDPLALLPGQRIRLREPTAAERRRAAQRRARLPRRYVVKPGDGLLLIAEKTKVSVNRLRSLNRKKNLNKLMPGMRLRLR